jgi:hypothetical protein
VEGGGCGGCGGGIDEGVHVRWRRVVDVGLMEIQYRDC